MAEKIIWRDHHLARWVFLGSISLFAIWAFFGGFLDPIFPADIIPRVFRGLTLSFIPFLILLYMLRIKLTYITKKGIRIGNSPYGDYDTLKLNKTKFILWENIQSIRLYKKQITWAVGGATRTFLVIRTNDKNRYMSFIGKPSLFIKVLKKLKKSHLLSKTSEYKDSWN